MPAEDLRPKGFKTVIEIDTIGKVVKNGLQKTDWFSKEKRNLGLREGGFWLEFGLGSGPGFAFGFAFGFA